MAAPLWLICYDIADQRVRRYNLRQLRAHAGGYQDSCFELAASDVTAELISLLVSRMDSAADRLLAVPVTQDSSAWQLGCGPIAPTGALMLIL